MKRVWTALPALLLAGMAARAGEPAVLAAVGPALPPPTLAAATPAAPATTGSAPADSAVAVAGERSGLEIYRRFREGLASTPCASEASQRYRAHFAHAPQRLARDGDLLPLFGYVVDALRDADLPTEYALIPFVESGYRPAARSPSGPAGLWQMIAVTARNHDVPIRDGYDGRLSPVDSTRAAVRYLKTLHGMFAGDWRLAVMAYNAGEYRVLGALRRSGMTAANAQPERLAGMPEITRAYVRKLDALSCLLAQAEERAEWRAALDRPVPRLEAVPVPAGVTSIAEFAARTGQDPERLRRLNPALAHGGLRRVGEKARLLAWAGPAPAAAGSDAVATGPAAAAASSPAAATEAAGGTDAVEHVVSRGENAWTIARRYGVRVADLLERNGLSARAVLRPGQRLLIRALGPGPR